MSFLQMLAASVQAQGGSKEDLEDSASEARIHMALEISGRHVIRVSETMTKLLMHTKVDVPFGDVMFPHQSVCIDVPHGFLVLAKFRIDEIYVFPHVLPDRRVMWRFACYSHDEPKRQMVSRLLGEAEATMEELFFMDEQTRSTNGVEVDSLKAVARLMANLALYMSQPAGESDVEFRPDTRLVAAKKMPRGPQREATEANFYKSKASQVYIVGFKTEEELKKLVAVYEHQGGTKSPHFRRGHWHRYWTGPKSQPELRKTIKRWIKPMIVAKIEGVDPPPTTYIVQEPQEQGTEKGS